MNPFRQGYKRIAFFTGVALILITIGVQYSQYKQSQELILSDLKHHVTEYASNFNLRARTIRSYVNGLKIAAENNLVSIKVFQMSSPLFRFLKQHENGKSYSLEVPPNISNEKITGNLIGLGSLNSFSQSQKNELNMSLLLDTNLEVALINNKGIAWAYYTSKNHFQNLHPWIPAQPNPYNPEIEEKPFFTAASPQANPRRLNVWTPVYEDGAGYNTIYKKGLIISNSSPVYDQNEFLGCVSLDLRLTELDRVIKRFDPLQGSLLLVNNSHQILALHEHNNPSLSLDRVLYIENELPANAIKVINQSIQNQADEFSDDGKALIFVRALQDAPWYMVYVGSKKALLRQAFIDMIEDIFILTAILLFIVGMGYLLVIRDFISPAQKLIDHISKENKGERSSPEGLPIRWKPWFEIVTRIFKENRSLLKNLENRVTQRTQQLEQKNKQLEQTLVDLKKAQNQIIVQEKLASLGALTAGIAHEIKNPLNFIINFSDLSLEYLEDLKSNLSKESDLVPLIEQNIQKAREHAEKADSIVKSMLAHARGSTGKITTFDLNSLLEETIELGYLGFQGKETHFTLKLKKTLDPKIGNVQGFQQDLARVFLNIVNNACFAMSQKQKQTDGFYTPELTVITKDNKNSAQIIIKDNGLGMKPALLKKIFTPFFTTKETGQGTGLGLSLSYDIITQQHHGQIKVESKEGEFTRFTIQIPKKQ